MEHEAFPVKGFEFMDEPATTEQRLRIVELAAAIDRPIDPLGKWPDPFTKWDAYNLIVALEEQLAELQRLTR